MSNDKLSAAEIANLREIAGTMVPADAGLGVPGADDPAVVADIVKSMGRDLPLVRKALAEIASRAADGFAGLGRVVLSAYYRDDRVLLALKHEARAPFPKGYTLEQGDWSLLDAVRHRPPLWRDDRKELPT